MSLGSTAVRHDSGRRDAAGNARAMRLFQVGVLLLTLALSGCKTETPASAPALRVFITYATFRPKCLTLTVVDVHDASHTASGAVPVDEERLSDTRLGVIQDHPGWSRDLRVTAVAHEGSCAGPVIASQSAEARFPTRDVTDLGLDLRAEDLDGDGAFAAKPPYPGTDCDDTDPAIHPGATELCDGIDNNCVAGENDAPRETPFWPDADADGYGDDGGPRVLACITPTGFTTRGGDCDDTAGDIHPGQAEFRCDGRDDNCDGVADSDGFSVGMACTTPLGCSGVLACAGPSASACASSEQPVAYFADDDGDGEAGQSVGPGCMPPEPGATREDTDCDEGSALARQGLTEQCDRLDNDCNGQTDDGVTGCASTAWDAREELGDASARFDAVAVYSRRHGWLAGVASRVLHVEDDAVTPVTNCEGEWKSAWAASNGRVFLGSRAGRFATLRPGEEAEPCESFSSGHAGAINGLVGFESPTDNIVTLYAVTSQGRVLRWRYDDGGATQEQPTVLTEVASNLRAIHGLDETTLLAVGAETVDGQPRPVAFRAPTSGTTWTKEELGVSDATGFLNDVRVLTPRLAYVAGDGALLLERSRDTWTRLPTLTVTGGATPDLRALMAFGRTALYAVSSEVNDVHFFNGSTWSTATQSPATLNALGGSGPGDVWATGHRGTLLRWTP
ncbi:putative metal-binding motif-containing protein [Myxococcus llanfairpwllgwyngyllgogerychwyrndrobwllllantysiliogogogochensis]|nr:putative metal-binding motif-containing protein [Myxococcus llanfairpwllgwyngyllgogerychwyrndrobwllllantysiliogogogochensis]